MSILKEYYARYLVDVRKLSKSSIGHYLDALNNISRFLKKNGLISIDIYEVMDINDLTSLRDFLFSDSEFIAQDKRGHQMYSAGLNNYYRFANGEDFCTTRDKLLTLDAPIVANNPVKVENTGWRRSEIIRNQALQIADFQCEIDIGHDSFIAENTRQKYMEGHHAIPMRRQSNFQHSLDIYANIVCLCPVCHRRIHFGIKRDRELMMEQIYVTRAERLVNSGIRISKEEYIATALD